MQVIVFVPFSALCRCVKNEAIIPIYGDSENPIADQLATINGNSLSTTFLMVLYMAFNGFPSKIRLTAYWRLLAESPYPIMVINGAYRRTFMNS